jgi:hypothetical protein
LIVCSNKIRPEIKKVLQDRVVVLQLAPLDEAIDLHLTSVTKFLFGSGNLPRGAGDC